LIIPKAQTANINLQTYHPIVLVSSFFLDAIASSE